MLKMPILNFVFSRNCLVLRRDEWYFSFDDTRGSLFSRGEGGHFMIFGEKRYSYCKKQYSTACMCILCIH